MRDLDDAPRPEGASAPPSRQEQGGRKGLFTQLFLEFFSIAVGVLFALAVNEWREDRAAMATARQALANINREIEINQRHLGISHEANLALVESWRSAEQKETLEPQFYAPAWGLQSSAWEVAQASGALNPLDFEVVSSIAGIYVFQDTYLGLVQQISQAQMMALLIRDDGDPQQALVVMDHKLRIYLDALITSEAQLLERYEIALRYAGGEAAPRSSPDSGAPLAPSS